MNRPKRLSIIALGCFVALIGVWLGLNLWPRTLEPELWPGTPLPPATGLAPLDILDGREAKRAEARKTAAADDWPGAFEQAFEVFRQDRDWQSSTTALVDQLAAILSLRKDLELLEELHKTKPPDDPDPSWEDLRNWDPAKLDAHKALAAEYRFSFLAVDSALREARGPAKLFFNRALTRRRLNAYFRATEKSLDDPSTDPPDPRRGPVGWFVNPGGESLFSLVAVDYGARFRTFEEHRTEIIRIRNRLLGL